MLVRTANREDPVLHNLSRSFWLATSVPNFKKNHCKFNAKSAYRPPDKNV